MADHALYLADEVAQSFLDDFMLLPFTKIEGNIMLGMPDAEQRQQDFFLYTH